MWVELCHGGEGGPGILILLGLLLGLLAVALLLAFIACAFSRWRCPHCGEFLGWNLGKGIPFCPYCHQRLDKE